MRRSGLHRLVVLLAFSVSLVTARGDSGYTSRTWTTDDGLPHNSVGRVLQDSTGFIWLGTVGGLARFDGSRIQEIPLPADESTFGFNVRGLAAEPSGAILALLPGGRLVRIQGSETELHPATDALRQLAGEPVDLFAEPDGVLWVGTFNGQLLRWQPDGETRIFWPDRPVAPRSKRFSFAIDERGATWIGSDSFLASFFDGKLQLSTDVPGGPLLLAPGTNGSIWVCTSDQLLRLQQQHLTVVLEDAPWHDDFESVRHLYETKKGELWITGRRSLYRFTGDQLHRIPTPYSLASFVTEDREGSLWVATDGSGVGQLREKSYTVFNADAGLLQDSISALGEDLTGRMWLANRAGGLVFLENGRARRLDSADPPLPVEVALATRNGELWFGGPRSGLWKLAPGATAPTRLPAPTRGLRLLLESRNGDVWFAADDDLGRYRGDRLEMLSEKHGLHLEGIHAIAEDSSGQIWIGNRLGELVRWTGDHFETVANWSVRQPIHAIFADPSGILWIATAGGLVVQDGDRFSTLTTEHGLPDNIVQAVVEDDHGNMWLAARRGLFYAAKSELLAVAQGRTGRTYATAYMFGRDQGLRGFSVAPNFQPTVCKSRDGHLWFATTSGAVEVDPSKIPRDLPPAPLLIDEVRFDGKQIEVNSEPLRFASGSHRIAFRLTALTYAAPENVLIQYQLEGVDQDWLEAGPDRLATYQNLSPGRYRLRARARNSAGVWSAGTTLSFVIVPAWWETMSFRVVAALAAAATLGSIVRTLSQRRLRIRLRGLAQARALDQERSRIARDLHDDLGVSLTEVGLLADRLVSTAPPELGSQLSTLARRTRRLNTELSSIVWTIHTRNSSLDKLAHFLRSYAERLFRNSDVACQVEGVEGVPTRPLAPEPQHQLLAATKEALNNVIKHSRASTVVLQMSCANEIFELSVADDGVGFKLGPEVVFEGNGLRNMTSRIKEIGGNVTITSDPGRGTTVTLRVAVPPVEPNPRV